MTQYQLLKRQASEAIAQHCQIPTDVLPCESHFDVVSCQERLDEHKTETLGCVRFIAALSRVDGCVLLDKGLVVHGFGVELRSDSDLSDIFIAGDTVASSRMLRKGSLSQYGTRHRAMMRYCYEHDSSLGFIISQDGDVRATMKVDGRLVLWENINVQLAFKVKPRHEHRELDPDDGIVPALGRFRLPLGARVIE